MHENNTAIDAIIRNTTKPRCICVAFCLFLLIVAAEVRFLFAFCCRSLSIKACSFACCFSLRLSFCCLCCSIFCCFFFPLYDVFLSGNQCVFSQMCSFLAVAFRFCCYIYLYFYLYLYMDWRLCFEVLHVLPYFHLYNIRASELLLLPLSHALFCLLLLWSWLFLLLLRFYKYFIQTICRNFLFLCFFYEKKEAKFFRFFLIYF